MEEKRLRMNERPARWLSRKFIAALISQLAAIGVLLWPEHEAAIVEASRSITALVVLMLAGLGYLSAEASVDRAKKAE